MQRKLNQWWFVLMLFLPFSINAQRIISIDSTGISADPNDLAFDSKGNLYITTLINNTILKIDTNNVITIIAGTGSHGFSGDGGPATAASLNQPFGIAIDTFGNVFFADVQNQRIRKIDKVTGVISTICGIGPGGWNTGGFFGDGGLATAAALNNPSGVYLDYYGNIYISDTWNGRIRKINTSGFISTIIGDGYGYTGDNGLSTSALCAPSNSVLFDNIGNIYFPQEGRGGNPHSIRKVNTLGIISTIAGDSTNNLYNGDNIQATNAYMNPGSIAFDYYGLLYVSDVYNNRVRMIDNLGVIHTIAGNGISGHGGDGGPATVSKIDQPSGLVFDRCGNLFISEVGGPSYIRKVLFNPTCNLSVPEEKTNAEVTIYPNPASEEITISGVKADVKWCLFNIKSIIEQQGILKAGSNTLSIEALSPGLYILELTIDDGTRIMKKIIKL